MLILGVLLIVFGLAVGILSTMTSRSDWAWNHRHAPWRTGYNVSENRATQTRVWIVASIVMGLVFIVLGILVIILG